MASINLSIKDLLRMSDAKLVLELEGEEVTFVMDNGSSNLTDVAEVEEVHIEETAKTTEDVKEESKSVGILDLLDAGEGKAPKRDKRVEGVIEDYQNGMKVQDIFKKHNISSMTMYNILEENGIEKRGQNVHKKPVKITYPNGSERIYDSVTEAAAANGVASSNLSRALVTGGTVSGLRVTEVHKVDA